MHKKLHYQSLWHGIAYAMLAVILIASLLPVEHIQHIKGGDKLHHFLSYGVLAWWCSLSFQISTLKELTLLGVKLILFGAIIEGLQHLSGYRFAEFLDFIANSVGVIVGSLIAFYLSRHFLEKIDKQLERLKN